MEHTASSLVERFQMLPHPEGGYYREMYRSDELIKKEALPERFPADRHFSTAIYFLLEQGNFSAFHRIQSDECWHFYTGQSLHVHVIHPAGKYELIRLGNDIASGETFQAIVPAGCWFASETAPGGEFSFVGCTVAPGFDFADFELAKTGVLCKHFPQQQALITRLCRQ
ncbi:MAG: cupin domain-containing protein [Bacteroidota bacterium]